MKNNNYYSLHLADVHFGKKDDIRLFNELKEVFINKIYEENKDIDFIIIHGDLYDRILRMNESGSKLVIDFITELCELSNTFDFKLRLIKGTKTHDFNQLEVFKKLENIYPYFRIINTVEEEELLENIFVLHIPEEYPENVNEYYEKYFNLGEGVKYDYIFGHGMFDFVAFTGHDDEDPSERIVRNSPTFKSKEIDKIAHGPIIFGHIHDRQKWRDKIYYVGSFSRFAFGEDKDKGFIECYYNPNTIKHKVSYVNNFLAPKYLTINIDELHFENIEEKLNYLNQIKNDYDFVKVKTSNEEENLDILKQTLNNSNNNIKLDVKTVIIDEEKIDERFLFITRREYDLPTTIQKFINIKHGKNIDLNIINELISEE